MKKLISIFLVVALLIAGLAVEPAQAASDETRKTVGIVVLVGVVAAVIGILAAGARIHSKTIRLIAVDGSDPLTGTFVTKGFSNSGLVTARVGSRAFSGQWTQLDSGADLASFVMATPSGPVTAFGLAQTGTPSGVAILEGDGVNLLCVWSGTFAAGLARCVDSSGRRYAGNW